MHLVSMHSIFGIQAFGTTGGFEAVINSIMVIAAVLGARGSSDAAAGSSTVSTPCVAYDVPLAPPKRRPRLTKVSPVLDWPRILHPLLGFAVDVAPNPTYPHVETAPTQIFPRFDAAIPCPCSYPAKTHFDKFSSEFSMRSARLSASRPWRFHAKSSFILQASRRISQHQHMGNMFIQSNYSPSNSPKPIISLDRYASSGKTP